MALARAGANFPNGYFIPEQFSKIVLNRYYAKSLIPNITNSTYQGELSGKGLGDTVHIRREPVVTAQDREVGGVVNWASVTDEEIQLTLDYNKVCTHVVHKEDKEHLFDIDVQKMLMEAFRKKLEETVTETILGAAYLSATTSLTSTAWQTSTNATAHVAQAAAYLSTLNIPMEDRVLVVHPLAAQYLSQQQSVWAQNSGAPIGAQITGYLGKYAGLTVFESSLIPGAGTAGNPYKCIALQKEAIAMAANFRDMATYDLPETLSTGLVGQAIFGFKVVQPDALVYLPVQVA